MYTLRFKAPTPRVHTKWGGHLITKGLPIPMTPRQKDVYLYVRYFWGKYGYGPSYLDIAYGLNLTSKNNIGRIVRRLTSLGIFEREKWSKRETKPAGVKLIRLLSR
jgi:SOS-response transcriptional repressor LexA